MKKKSTNPVLTATEPRLNIIKCFTRNPDGLLKTLSMITKSYVKFYALAPIAPKMILEPFTDTSDLSQW